MKINLKDINSKKLKIYYDKRGYFYEVYNIDRYKKNLFKLIFLIQNKMLSEDFTINVSENNLN